MSHSWPEVLGTLVRGDDLADGQAEWAMTQILEDAAADAQIAGFAVALRAKGESSAELAALVQTMLRFATPIEVSGDALDTCGTGGDRSGTVNVSTMAALVAAAGGARVVKHGNRAASSQCGSADVLEALGVALDLDGEGVAKCVEAVGIGFCFAPRFHPAMRFAAPARKALGVATTFNFLGPLANPARVPRRSLGVSDATMADRMLGALMDLGVTRALVYFGHDGLDELTTTTTSTVLELRDGSVTTTEVDPVDLGLARADHEALVGGDAAANTVITRATLGGEPGPVADIVALNAAAALVAADLVPDLAAGVERAQGILSSGTALEVLEGLVRVSTEAAG